MIEPYLSSMLREWRYQIGGPGGYPRGGHQHNPQPPGAAENREALLMEKWIRFSEPLAGNAVRYHQVIASNPENGRMATLCGRAFGPGQVIDTLAQPERRCTHCQRRLERSQYLVPTGAALERLLATPYSPQMQLFELPLLRPLPPRRGVRRLMELTRPVRPRKEGVQ